MITNKQNFNKAGIAVIDCGFLCSYPSRSLPNRLGREDYVNARRVATPAMPAMVGSPDGDCQVLGRLVKWCDFAGLRVNRNKFNKGKNDESFFSEASKNSPFSSVHITD